jgi:hypothetical protein
MISAVKLELDQVSDLNSPVFFTYQEILYWLNLAQPTLVKQKLFGNNARQEGFEQTQKRIDDIISLVKEETGITLISAGSNYPDSYYIATSSIGSNSSKYMYYLDSQPYGELYDTLAITGATQTNPVVVTVNDLAYLKNGDSITIASVGGMVELDGTHTVANISTTNNTFECLGVNGTGYTAYTSGGTVDYTQSYHLFTDIITTDLIDKFIQTPFNKPYIEKPKVFFLDDKLYIIPDADTGTLSTITVKYIQQPKNLITSGVTQNNLNISGVTKANPAVVTVDNLGNLQNGDEILILDVVGMTQLNGNTYTVANIDTSAVTFELSGTNSTGYGTWSSGGIVGIYSIERSQLPENIHNELVSLCVYLMLEQATSERIQSNNDKLNRME